MKVSRIEIFTGVIVTTHYEDKIIEFTRDNLLIWDSEYRLLEEDINITEILSYVDDGIYKIDFWGYKVINNYNYLKIKIAVTI